MRHFAIGLCVTASILVSACAGRPGTATSYRPAGLLGGYKDKQLAPNIWEVSANSNGIAEQGMSQNMAAYRAAEIVKAAGFSHFEIIDQKGHTRLIGVGAPTSFAGEDLKLVVRGKNDAGPPTECRAKSPDACFTMAVDDTIARLEPRLYFPKSDPRHRPDQ